MHFSAFHSWSYLPFGVCCYRLKRQKTIPEKDAKAIFMQIMSGLRYLDRPFSYGGATTPGAATG
jgi:predicted aldo/keto reductase-like oxidoreductase